jgi:nucleotide-binding universal stress UspA family protein
MGEQERVRIVVGVDGSVHDSAVIAAALLEADARGATVHVVHAIDITMLDITGAVTQASAEGRATYAAHAAALRCELRHHVDAIATELDLTVHVDFQVRRGDPATCLLDAARDAALIVTGTRSAGAGSPFLLGTVSQDVAVHASCPVLLIPTKH